MTDIVERRDLYIAIARLARIVERQQDTIDRLKDTKHERSKKDGRSIRTQMSADA